MKLNVQVSRVASTSFCPPNTKDKPTDASEMMHRMVRHLPMEKNLFTPKTEGLTIQEAADILGVSTKTLRRWEARGKLVPGRSKGNQRRYSKDQLIAFSYQYEDKPVEPLPLSEELQETKDDLKESLLLLVETRLLPLRHYIPSYKLAACFILIFILCNMFVLALIEAGSDGKIGNIVEANSIFIQKYTGKARNLFGLNKLATTETSGVLAATKFAPSFIFSVNVPSNFKQAVEMKKDLHVGGNVLVDGAATISGQLTAPNVLYGLEAGLGITLSLGQTPTVSNSGVLSLDGQSGDLDLGDGLTLDGQTIVNDDPGSAQKIFGNIKVGSTTIAAGNNTDTVELIAGSGITLSPDSSSKTVTITGTTATATGWLDNGSSVVLETASDSVGVGSTNPSSFKLQVAGDVGPDANNSYDLGSSLLNWRSLYLSNTLALGSDTVSDLTGTGLTLSGAAVTLDLLTSVDGTGNTSSNSGLELQGVSSNSLTLLQGCSNNQLLKWDDTNSVWGCGNDVGGSGSTISVAEGGTTYTGIDTVNFNQNDFDVAQNVGTANVTLDSSLVRFRIANGAMAPSNNTLDLLLGGTATSSARFGFLNVDSGTPTATMSAGTNGGLYITANGTLQTTANQSLTIGGNTTGNITLSPLNGSGTVTSTGNLNIASGKTFQINSTDILSSTTLGSSVVTSSLTSVGALTTGSITSGFGNIDVGADAISGGDITSSGTTGFVGTGNGAGLSFSGTGNHDISVTSGTLRLGAVTLNGAVTGNNQSVTGLNNLSAGGTITFSSFTTDGGLLYTNGSGVLGQTTAGSAGQCLQSNAGGAPSWASCGINYWQLNNGALSPFSNSADLLVGGTATSSAKFGFLNVDSGTPTATMSAGTNGGLYITAAGNLQTTANQTLTLGGNTTGNITLSPLNGSGRITSNGTFNLTSGNTIQINSTDVLSSTTLGAGVVNSSLTSVGNIGTGVWQATAIGAQYGGTGQTTVTTGDLLYGSGTNIWSKLAIGTNGQVLSISGGVPAWTSTSSINFWQRNAGTLAPLTITDDLVLGTTATASARFGVLNVASGTPVATMSAGSAGGTYLTAAGTLQTTANQSLTIGGDTTGDIILNPLNQNGTVTTMGNMNLSLGKVYQINTANVLTSTTLGSTVVNSSLTSVGALAGGSIANGFGTISTSNTITGTTLNGTTGINTGAGAGTQRISNTGNLTSIGTTQFNGVTYTWPGADGSTGYVLSTNAAGTLSWIDVSTAQTSFWSLNNGAIVQKNTTLDLLLGGTATTSAKFAFINMNSGTPTASVSAGTNSGAYFTADGTLATTANQTLTLGNSSTTGNIHFFSNANILATDGTLTLAGDLNVNGDDITSDADLTFNPAGGNVLFADNDTLNIGGAVAAAFNFFAGSTGGSNSADGDNDLYIEDELEVDGAIRFDNSSITFGNGAFSTCTALETSSGVLTCGTDDGGGQAQYWQLNNGAISPFSDTADLLVGGTATTSAKFGFINVTTGTPTATVSAGTAGGVYLTANGTLQMTANQALTIGGNTTGALTFSPLNGSGALHLNVGSLLVNSNPGSTTATPSCVTTTNGIVTGIGTCDTGGGGSKWNLANGAVYPVSASLDVLIGSSATTSAKFGFINVNTGTPTASVSAGAAGATYLTAAGTIANTAMQTLTLGGSTTGAVVIDAGTAGITLSDATTVSDNLTVAGTTGITATGNAAGLTFSDNSTHTISASSGTLQLGAFTLSGAVTGNSQSITGLTQLTVDNLRLDGNTFDSTSGDITLDANGGNILFADGDTLNIGGAAAAAFNFLAGSTAGNSIADGDNDLYIEDELEVDGAIRFDNSSITFGNGAFTTCSALETSSGVLTCGSDDGGGSTQYWQLNNGAIAAFSNTADLLVGGTATTSAKFAFVNVDSGTPTASVSAGTNGALYLTAAGAIATTANQPLILGSGSTTGDIQFYTGSNSLSTSGTLTLAGDLNVNGNDLATAGDLTINAGGNNVLLADGDTLNVGGAVAAAFNFFAGSTAGNSIADGDSDLYIEDELEVDGAVRFDSGTITLSGFANCTALETSSGVLTCGTDDGGGSTQYWQLNNGAISPFSNTADLLVGGTATTSAKFGFINVNTGTPTATVSAGTAGGVYITADGTLQTTALQALNIGGNTTGTINLSPNGGTNKVNSTGTMNLSSGKTYQINNTDVLSSTTLGSGVTTSSLTSVGTIGTGVWQGTAVGAQFGGTDQTTVTTGDLLYGSGTNTWGKRAIGSSGQILTVSGGVPVWSDAGGTINFWQRNNGTVAPLNITDDLLLGATGTTSARFGFINVASGTPTASVSAGTNGALSLTSTGIINTTAMQTLTLGGSTTGAVVIDAGTGGITLSDATTVSDNLTVAGTTGISATGNGAGITFSHNSTHIIQASSGTLQINAFTLGGTLAANAQTISGIGTATFGASNVNITGTTIGLTTDTDLLSFANGALTVNGTITADTNETINGIDINSGTISDATWNGTAIGAQYGGTGDDTSGTTGVPYIGSGNWQYEATLDETRGGTAQSSYATGDLLYASGTDTLAKRTIGSEGNVLTVSGGVPVWSPTSSINFWQRNNGTLAPLNITDDLLLGGIGTTSAKFALMNVASGTPTASISAGTNGAVSLTATGNLVTTAMQTLTLGNSTTGNVVIDSGTGVITLSDATTISDNLTIAGTTGISATGNGAGLTFSHNSTHIIQASSGTLQLNAFTLGGTLSANAQTISGIGTASFGTGNVNITGTTVGLTSDTDLLSLAANALTINGSLSSTGDFSANANTTLGDAITDSITFTGRVAQDSDLIPITATGTNDLGATALPWDNLYVNNVITTATSGQNGWWQRNNGSLAAYNITDDILLGATSTSSARLALINIASGTPTATISAGTTDNAAFLTGAGNLATTNMQNLSIGGSTTGNITLNARNALGTITASATNLTLSGTTTLTGTSLTTITGGATAIDFSEFDVNAGTGAITINDGGDLGNITIESTVLDVDSLDFTAGGTITTGASNDLTLNPGDGNVLFANGDTLNVGGATAQAYNFFAGSTAGSSIADGDDDLYIADEFEVDGAVRFESGTVTLAGFTGGGSGCSTLETNGSGVLACGTDDGGGFGSGSNWRINAGTISPFSATLDILAGATATASAKIGLININSGTPTATVSANSGDNATFLSGTGNLATTNMQNLSIGGSTTGNITVTPRNGNGLVTIDGDLNLTTGNTFQINGTDVLSGSTLGSGITTSSLTTVGALNSGSITSGFGSIDVGSDNITGGTLNGTTGINTGASAGTQRIDSSGNLVNIGTTQFNTVTYTWPSGGQSSGYVLTTNGSGTLSWTDPVTVGSNWNVSNGVIRPKFASVVDLLLGHTATASAKFGVLNINSGTPVATISANSGNNATFLNGTGNLATTNMQILSLGGSTTGDITLNARNALGTITASATNLTLSGTTTLTGSSLTSITGGATAIDFTEFDVNAGTGAITINDGGNAGNINIESTVLDIDSLTFVGTGDVISTGDLTLDATTDINLDADGADILFKDAGTTFATFTNSTTDLTLTIAGGNLISSSALNFGGAGAANYNFFASSTAGVSTPDGVADLYVQDELEVDGTVRFNNITYTFPSGGESSGYALTTNGSGTLSWTDPVTVGSNWNVSNGVIRPKFASVVDFLLGHTATTSAKFGVLNINSGTPVASISANSGNNAASFTGTGILSTTNMQNLTIGGSTTGDITLNARNAVGTITASATNLTLAGTTTLTGTSLTTITGGATAIDFTEFDVNANTGSITINDGGNAGSITVESTVLDSNSLDFTTNGTVTTGSGSNLTFTPGGTGDTIVSADADSNFQINSSAAPGVDIAVIDNDTQATSTTGVDGLQIDFANTSSGAITNAALNINVTSNNTNASSNLHGVYIGNLTSGGENASEVALRIGTGWDSGITIESGGLTYSGNGRPTKTFTLSPEYAGATITASNSATITGEMTSDASHSANFRTYYEWNASDATNLQNYTVAVRVTLPEDFDAWATSNAIVINYNTELSLSADNKFDVHIYNPTDSTSNPVYFSTNNVGGTGKTWTTLAIDDSALDDGSGADWDENTTAETAIIYLKMYSRRNFYTQIGDITFSYLADF